MAEHRLDGSLGGGAHIWRAVWNAEVSEIYKNVLSGYHLHMLFWDPLVLASTDFFAEVGEPRFGKPPKPDRYAEVKRMKRYA
jgi:large subunit ribosomal protein L35